MPYADRKRRLEYQRKWNREFYLKNKQEEKERVYKRKKKIAQWFANYKSSLSCEKCGEKDPVCLDFHHHEPSQKDFTIASLKSWGWGIERLKKEIAKCDVLCANCHRKTHSRML